MPNSNDNQDFGKSDDKNKNDSAQSAATDKNKMTSDDLKGKKVDADPEEETDQPIEQKK